MSAPQDIAYYQVWKSINGGTYSLLGTTTGNSYVDNNVVPGNTYSYYLIAVDLYENQDTGSSNSITMTENSQGSKLLNINSVKNNIKFKIVEGKVISELDLRYDILRRYNQ